MLQEALLGGIRWFTGLLRVASIMMRPSLDETFQRCLLGFSMLFSRLICVIKELLAYALEASTLLSACRCCGWTSL